MNPRLTIVIASHADNAECLETVNSIYATAPQACCDLRLRIIIVDDASPVPVSLTIPTVERYGAVMHYRNRHRIGCGPSRHVGASLDHGGEWLLITDSHMRFLPGWFEAWEERADRSITTMHCGSCVPFDAKNPTPNLAKAYFGADWNFYGNDRNTKPGVRPKTQVFECVWRSEQTGDQYELPAVMGASYFIHRDFFLGLNALRHLRSWGGDEQELSLKVWLAGGCIRMLKGAKIAHKFKLSALNKIQPWEVAYNKLFLINTLLPKPHATALIARTHRDMHLTIASKRLREDWHLVESELAHNAAVFRHDFWWYLEKFGLKCPT